MPAWLILTFVALVSWGAWAVLSKVAGDGAHYKYIKSDEDRPMDEWIHLAGTYDNQEFKLYANGRLVKSVPYAVPFQFGDTNPLIIGGNTNTQGKKWVDCFHGLIDEVKLFNRSLTEKEVLELWRISPIR